LDAAEKLLNGARTDVAAYLFGIAAECAVKEMARAVQSGRDSEVFHSHFPALRSLLLDRLQGRAAQPLRLLKEHGGFMNQWDITMRYAPNEEVRRMPIGDWAVQARRAVSSMGA
jgi:hypothetical protein